MSKCNRDCFNCPYPDCINDEGADKEEIAISIHTDRSITDTRFYADAKTRYAHSEKGRECKRRYRQTERGKENDRRFARNYYKSNRERELARRHAYYLEHAEEIKEKRRQRYAEVGK